MRIVVTGAGGYVGVLACAELLSRGHDVIGLDRYFFGQDKLGPVRQHPRFTLLIDDIRSFDPGLLDGIEAVVDLAGLSNDLSAAMDPALTHAINLHGCARVARAARRRGVRRYVFASSASVYGAGEKPALDEADPCRPQTEYARAKLSIEGVLRALHGPAFEPVILRNATVFGLAPRMRFDLALNVMTLHGWRDGVIPVTGGGRQWRPFVHVRDVARAIVLAVESPACLVAGETFNVGDDRLNLRIDQLARTVCDAMPGVRLRHLPGDSDVRTYHLSFAKVARVLGFGASIGLADGVREIHDALERGVVSAADPTTITLSWYRHILEGGLRPPDAWTMPPAAALRPPPGPELPLAGA